MINKQNKQRLKLEQLSKNSKKDRECYHKKYFKKKKVLNKEYKK